MRAFACPVCGRSLFFENSLCLRLRHPARLRPRARSRRRSVAAVDDGAAAPCANPASAGCNWLLDARRAGAVPARCRADPDPAQPTPTCARPRADFARTRGGQAAAASSSSSTWGCRWRPATATHGLAFDLLSSAVRAGRHRPRRRRHHHRPGRGRRRPPRADAARELGEPYRTMLGHLRHEIGHYYWAVLVERRPAAARRVPRAVRRRAGGLRARPCDRHYAQGPPPDWEQRLRQRLRDDAPVGGLGRDVRPLPAHPRHAADRGGVRHAGHRPDGCEPEPHAAPGPRARGPSRTSSTTGSR